MQREDAWKEFMVAYKADDYAKTKAIAAKWGFDVFDDPEEGGENE
jgi:hypothetical protein